MSERQTKGDLENSRKEKGRVWLKPDVTRGLVQRTKKLGESERKDRKMMMMMMLTLRANMI